MSMSPPQPFAWLLARGLEVAVVTVVIGLGVDRWYEQPGAARLLTSADALTVPSLYDDLFRNIHQADGWHFSAANHAAPDFVLYAVLRSVAGGFMPALAGFGIAQQIALFLLARSLFREVGGRKGRTFAILYCAAWLAVIIDGLYRDSALWTNATFPRDESLVAFDIDRFPGLLTQFYIYSLMIGHHFGAYLASLFCFLLYIRFVRTGRNALLVLSVTLAALALMSDGFFIIYFSLPAMAVALLAASGFSQRRGHHARFLVATAVVTLLAFVLYRSITPPASEYASSVSLPDLETSAGAFLADIGHALAVDPSFMVVFLILPLCFVLACFVALAMRWASQASHNPSGGADWPMLGSPFGALVAYIVFAGLGTLAFLGVSGLYVNWTSARYLAPLIYSPALTLLAFLGLRIDPLGRTVRAFVPWCAATVLAASALWLALSRPLVGVGDLFPAPAYLRCFDGASMEAGLADYWEAKPLSMYSAHRLQVVAVMADGTPFVWGSSAFWYVDSWVRPGTAPRYNFIFMRRLDPPSIARRYGQPARVVHCADSEVWWYATPNVLYDRLVQENSELARDAALVHGPTTP